MTAAAQRKPGAAGTKSPASLLTIPIFKPTRRPEPPPRREAVPEPKPETAAEAPAAAPDAATPREASAAADEPRYRDLRQYWRRLGHGAAPAVEDLDGALIAARWPYTLLIRVPEDGPLDIVRVFAPAPECAAANGASHPLAGDEYSQLSSWVLQLAREAVGGRNPLETRESFQLRAGPKRFAAQAFPCESRADAAGYVMLNIAEG